MEPRRQYYGSHKWVVSPLIFLPYQPPSGPEVCLLGSGHALRPYLETVSWTGLADCLRLRAEQDYFRQHEAEARYEAQAEQALPNLDLSNFTL